MSGGGNTSLLVAGTLVLVLVSLVGNKFVASELLEVMSSMMELNRTNESAVIPPH